MNSIVLLFFDNNINAGLAYSPHDMLGYLSLGLATLVRADPEAESFRGHKTRA